VSFPPSPPCQFAIVLVATILAYTNIKAPRFHDHQIITSRKDAVGTELLSLPFRKEELEAILEDLMT
jgi:hypothetical protein